jgi:hypothetical protein
MKSFFLAVIVTTSLFCAETVNIFLGNLDRAALRSKRVSISGQVERTGCDALPCALMGGRFIENAKVLFILRFPDQFQPYVKRKRVLDPIRVNCVMVSDFEYEDCVF